MHLNSLAFLLIGFTFSAISYATPLSERLDTLLASTAQSMKLSGTVGVKKGNELYFKGIGTADDSQNRPNSESTIFLIASNTKQFTGAAILKLEEEGLLKTSDPITKFFPDYPIENITGTDGKAVTVEQLARHESGLAEVYALPEITEKLFQKPISFQDLYSAIRTQKLISNPGTEYKYSNMGYVFLGEIVRRTSGMSFSEYVTKKLFEPAGLKNTTVGSPAETSQLAQCYDASSLPRQEFLAKHGVKEPHTDEVFTDGNIFSTAPDFLRWMDALISGKVLGPVAMRKMFEPSALGNYGFGIIVSKNKDGALRYLHTGRWLGFDSIIIAYPEKDAVITFLSNQNLNEEEQKFYSELVKAALEP